MNTEDFWKGEDKYGTLGKESFDGFESADNLTGRENGMSISTKEWWAGEFGDAYTKRNRVDWQRRVPFWKKIILTTGARSALEFGCGSGWNLSAIKRSFPDVSLAGVEINLKAIDEAIQAGVGVYDSIEKAHHYDLVFTCGVLIHTPPEDLQEIMTSIVNHSRDYVLAVEYYYPEEKEIEYRGEKGKLWARPYGYMYQTLFPNLTLVSEGHLDKPAGFDDCQFWLYRK